MQIRGLTTAALSGFTTDLIQKLTTDQLPSLTSRQVVGLSTDLLRAFTTDQWRSLKSSQINALKTSQFAALGSDNLVALTTDQWAKISSTQLRALATDKIPSLASDDFRALTSAQWQKLSSDQLRAFGTDQYRKLSSDNLRGLTSVQIGRLATDDLAQLATDQWRSFTTLQLGGLKTDQVRSVFQTSTDNLRALTSVQIRGLTTAALNALTTDLYTKLLTDQLRGLTTAQISKLATDDLNALTSDQWAGFTSVTITALTASQLSKLGTNYAAGYNLTTPLVLDLNGDGIKTQSVDKGVVFDLAATGTPAQVGWVSKQDGFLVRDLNGDRRINDGSELFGEGTTLASGEKAEDGYQALAELDTNQDGVIDANDPGFASLAVWRDKNADGVSQKREIKPLDAYGITRLDVTPEVSSKIDQGNLIGLVSKYDTKAGDSLEMADVWFETRPVDSLRSNVANLANTLTMYQSAAGDTTTHHASGGFDLADKLAVVDKHDAVGTVVNDLVDNLKHYNANGMSTKGTLLMAAAQTLNTTDCLLSDRKDKGGILGGSGS